MRPKRLIDFHPKCLKQKFESQAYIRIPKRWKALWPKRDISIFIVKSIYCQPCRREVKSYFLNNFLISKWTKLIIERFVKYCVITEILTILLGIHSGIDSPPVTISTINVNSIILNRVSVVFLSSQLTNQSKYW